MEKYVELRDLFSELVHEVYESNFPDNKPKDEKLAFTDRAKSLIKEMADYSRRTKLYEHHRDNDREFWEDVGEETPEKVYAHMLNRVNNAPLNIHMYSSIILLMPKLDELVNGGV